MGASRSGGRAGARRRLPDEVRAAAVRAGIAFAFTLVCLMVTVLASLARSWGVLPALLITAAGVLASTWCLLDIGIARQVAAQRQSPGSTTTRARAAGADRAGRHRAPREPRDSQDYRDPSAGGGREGPGQQRPTVLRVYRPWQPYPV
jgi:hypothetical protein